MPKKTPRHMAQDFESYLEENRDEIEALTIFYSQPARRSELTYAMIQRRAGQAQEGPAQARAAARLAGLRPCSMTTRATTPSAN